MGARVDVHEFDRREVQTCCQCLWTCLRMNVSLCVGAWVSWWMPPRLVWITRTRTHKLRVLEALVSEWCDYVWLNANEWGSYYRSLYRRSTRFRAQWTTRTHTHTDYTCYTFHKIVFVLVPVTNTENDNWKCIYYTSCCCQAVYGISWIISSQLCFIN